MFHQKWYLRSFTLIEVLVVIGIIATLSAVALVAVNPARQFKLARDTQRSANLTSLLNALHQNLSEHRGLLVCDGANVTIPSQPTFVASASSTPSGSAMDLADCLMPDYLPVLPFDPSHYGAYYHAIHDYNTGYQIFTDNTGRLTASATGELSATIFETR